MNKLTLRQAGVGLIVVLVVMGLFPGLAAAQNGIGGSIVVEEGETVSEVSGVAGAIIVHGTVTGDVSGAAGNVVITGSVDGDVSVATGNLRIAGDVGGDVSAGGGNVHLEDGATVAGNFDVGAGVVRIEGSIGGDARIGAESIELGDDASIAGSLTYDGQLEGNLDAVAGDITRDRTLGPTTVTELQPLVSWVFAVYAFLMNLLLGIILLALFPRFSLGVADRAIAEPVKTGLVGLGVLVVVPLLLIALFITVIGIPLGLVGTLIFLFIAWVSLIYGRFVLGMWLLSAGMRNRLGFQGSDDATKVAGVDRKWVALVLGLALGALLGVIPVVGGLVNFLLFLLGLGAIALVLNGRRGGDGTGTVEHPSEEPPAG